MMRLKSAQVPKAERQALMARSRSVGPLDTRSDESVLLDDLCRMFHLRPGLSKELREAGRSAVPARSTRTACSRTGGRQLSWPPPHKLQPDQSLLSTN